MKKIAVLGSTGSIGVNSLKVIAANPGEYKVVALGAGRNLDLLTEQIEKFHPIAVAVCEEGLVQVLKDRFGKSSGPKIFSGIDGYKELVSLEEIDTVISAMAGAAGMVPTHAAIEAGKDIALANKETMVMAGPLIMELAEKQRVSILPIDSEHSAILQSLQGHRKEDLRKIILTASGGPFIGLSMEEMGSLTPDMALKHPNWSMGRKITIDSSTLMNKGLEVIEAKWLFDLNMDQISIVIHPESIIHSMVEYIDGSIIAQMGVPDMITPISYALSYPRHRKTPLPPLKIEEIGALNFQKPDQERFRCLPLALRAAKEGGSMPAVLNGANEIAVEAFLGGKIEFLQIPAVIERTMEAHKSFPIKDIDEVIEADIWARGAATTELSKL